MIFVTVGTQLPFDRMIRAVDAWAASQPATRCVAQIGPGTYKPEHMQWQAFLKPSEADALMRDAELIVAHAGMGSVLTALRLRTPIVLLPRKASLGEHRNEHQLATARWLDGRAGIRVAWEADELASILDARDALAHGDGIPDVASGPLVERLRGYIAAPH